MSKFEYVKLADAIAADISNGVLKPGDRLPPQRDFAYERGIAVSTASRVYTELLRRGLVVGEVGRGTFISGDVRREVEAMSEPREGRIDFEVNYPFLPQQWPMIAKSLAGLERVESLEAALRTFASTGTKGARIAAAAYLGHEDWTPQADQIVFTANGKQSIAAALSALVPAGGRCGVEALTYPFVKNIAARLGITLVPIAMDEMARAPMRFRRRIARRICRRCTSSRRCRTRSASSCRRRGAPISCASPRSSTSPSSRTPSTGSWATKRRSRHSRRTAASRSTAYPRRSRQAWRSASSSLRPACAKA